MNDSHSPTTDPIFVFIGQTGKQSKSNTKYDITCGLS